jgi:dGTPase
MYNTLDAERHLEEKTKPDDCRTTWRKDYTRLIHCPSFRRLQGKTQLYPSRENDFFRNRLTHSIEVASIAKSITELINNRYKYSNGTKLDIEPQISEFAGLAHDLGHPPFGHHGEEALDECMRDCGGFEGNAQTLRILSKIEKKHQNTDYPTGINSKKGDMRIGLNLSFRSLASILKYDKKIPYSIQERIKVQKSLKQKSIQPVKGYYASEAELVSKIKWAILSGKSYSKNKFKTVECQIMDISDDIAYSTYDLEDGLKAGFYNPFDIVFPGKEILVAICEKVNESLRSSLNYKLKVDDITEILLKIFRGYISNIDVKNIKGLRINKSNFESLYLLLLSIHYESSRALASKGYIRIRFTSELVHRFITKGINFKLDNKIPPLSIVELNEEQRIEVEVLKKFNYVSQILSPKLKITEYRGKEIVKRIFETLTNKEQKGYQLLPNDYRELYESVNRKDKKRIICDFVSGMTDSYAIEFYGRLTSENPETIFKPY